MQRELLIQPLTMVRIKIREGVMVDRHAPAQPPVGTVRRAQLGDPPRAGLMIDDRVQPHRHQNARVDRRTPGVPFHRLHPRIQRRQI